MKLKLYQASDFCFRLGRDAQHIISDPDDASSAIDDRKRDLAVGTLLGLEGTLKSVPRQLSILRKDMKKSKQPIVDRAVRELGDLEKRVRGVIEMLPGEPGRDEFRAAREAIDRMNPAIGRAFDLLESICARENR